MSGRDARRAKARKAVKKRTVWCSFEARPISGGEWVRVEQQIINGVLVREWRNGKEIEVWPSPHRHAATAAKGGG